MRRILITGAAGCLGKALSNYLKSKNEYEIYATSKSLSVGCVDGVLDVSNTQKLRICLREKTPDIIFHLASTYSKNFQASYHLNVEVTKNLLEIVLDEFPSTRVVLIGSAAEYGLVKEEDNPIKENFKLSPITTYGLVKAWQSLLIPYFHSKGLNIVLARIFNLYGEGLSSTLLAGHVLSQIKAYQAGLVSKIITGNLSQFRDYISVENAAKILEHIAFMGKPGEIYHVGTGVPMLSRDLVIKLLNYHHISKDLLFENEEKNGYSPVKVIYADLTKTNDLIRSGVMAYI